MSRRARVLLALAAAAVTALAAAPSSAQTAAPAPPPPTLYTLPSAPISAAAAQPAPGAVATIKAQTQLVVVDVVVTDAKENPVHGLKASDFTLMEDGAAQQITGFEEHSAPTAAQLAKAPTMPRLPPGIFTNFTPAPPGSAVNILLLDALNTQMRDQMYVREQLLDFVRKAAPGTRIAIFGLNDRLIMLQGFTSDLTLLKAVLEKSIPGSSMMLADNVGNGGTDTISQQLTDVSGGAGDVAQLVANLAQMEAVQAADDSQIRARATLDAMNQLAHYLAGIPGRKNLIWFSGSFPLNVFPNGAVANPATTVEGSQDEFRQTTNLLTSSQVAVYTVDARGLQTQDDLAIAAGQGGIGKTTHTSDMTRGAIVSANAKAFETNANEHMTLSSMAADTGGHAYMDNNGLASAVSKAIDNGANYYTLSYRPADQQQNGAFRKIQVKLDHPGASLAYRAGYFAPDAKHPLDAGNSPMQPTSFVRAMLRGAPNATEIMLKLQAFPATAATETAVAKDNILSPEPAVKDAIKGPFRRYTIDVAADAHDILITPTPDGRYTFTIELRTFVYDSSGHVVDVAMQRARGNLTPSSLANLLHIGLQFHQEVSVPATGDYFLRTSLHDPATDRFGSVEIPVASIARLTPLNAAPAPATH